MTEEEIAVNTLDEYLAAPSGHLLDNSKPDELRVMVRVLAERLIAPERRDRAIHALSRFVFPGHLVPRAEMADAVMTAVGQGDDYADYLPAKRIVRPDAI